MSINLKHRNYLGLTLAFIMFTLACSSQTKVSLIFEPPLEGYTCYTECAINASELLEKVINSDEFSKFILNGTFTETRDLSNNQILDSIRYGNTPGIAHQITLRVRTINSSDPVLTRFWCKPYAMTGTIGIDGGESGVIAICPRFLKKYCQELIPYNLAGHYLHEYLHLIGFRHDHNHQSSLVYQAGNYINRENINP